MYFALLFISLCVAGRAIHDAGRAIHGAGDVISLVQLRATSSSQDVDDVIAEPDTLLQRLSDRQAESTHRVLENMDDMPAGDQKSEKGGTEALAAERKDVRIDFDYDVSDESPGSDFQLCRANPPDGKRILISAVVEAFHGSTALEEVFMSSDKVTTPCSCGTWQCETIWLKTAQGNVWTWNYTRVLGGLSGCWDLEKKVFFEKFMLGNHCPAPQAGDAEDDCRSRAVLEFDHRVQEAELPDSMVLAGVKDIEVVHVLMWRPLCLAYLSSYSKSMIDTGHEFKLTQIEVISFKEMVIAHKSLKKAGAKVMLINLGSLIWEPRRSKARIETLVPCLGEVDMDFVPLLGRDIVGGNEFKASGSVKEYGESIDPSGFYDVMSGQCTDESFLDGLDEVETRTALAAIRYLRKHSQNEVDPSEESEAEKLDVVVRGEE